MSDFPPNPRGLLLVLGNAFFVAAEYALVTARRHAPDGARRTRQPRRAHRSAHHGQPVRFIGTVQLGITVFSIALGAVGEPLVEQCTSTRSCRGRGLRPRVR